MAHQDTEELPIQISKLTFHELTEGDLTNAEASLRRARKAKIEGAFMELQKVILRYTTCEFVLANRYQHAEETMLMISRELGKSNTSTPACIKKAFKAIKKIDLSKTWAHHEAEMSKFKLQRDKDHRIRINKAQASALAKAEAASAVRAADVAKPQLVLTRDQINILQQHLIDKDAIPTKIFLFAQSRLPARKPASVENPARIRE
ncbi:hypothetical protein VTL71DRAFT_8810 [Oculimacula yallundae]|uniref:Uncharacterized protein n=1 Tax=Oculimacula yallundae TaxID=86028 RepID=A0ABR4CYW1_9HELO